MKLFIKQKVFSLNAKFSVKDEFDNDRFFVEGDFLSLKSKLHIYDSNSIEAAVIYRRLMTFMPHFIIETGGIKVAELVKEFTLLKPKYRIEGTNLRILGDFLEHEYELTDGIRIIMHMSKQWFTWGDTYVLDIADPADELLALSFALALDCVMAADANC